MIPDRAPERKTGCLTMCRYQEMPLLPAVSNKRQEAIVAQAEELAPACPKIERKKLKINPESRKKAGATLSTTYAQRNEGEVKKLFAQGPLTVNQIQRKMKLRTRNAATYKVREWIKRGLIIEAGTQPSGSIKKHHEKLWGMA